MSPMGADLKGLEPQATGMSSARERLARLAVRILLARKKGG